MCFDFGSRCAIWGKLAWQIGDGLRSLCGKVLYRAFGLRQKLKQLKTTAAGKGFADASPAW